VSLPDSDEVPGAPGTPIEKNSEADAPEFFPCTPPQQRCYFLDKLEHGNPALNVAIRWQLTGPVTPEIVERAFHTVIDRHEILRMRFVEVDGVPMQDPRENIDFNLTTIDVRDIPADEREAHVSALGQREVRVSFELTVGPLIRATLYQMEDGRALLLTVIHQSAFDGWSIRVFGRELGACIAAFVEGKEPELPTLALQYADYALWLEEYYSSSGFEVEKDYWLEQLSDLPYFEIEPDKARAPQRTTKGAIVSTLLSPEISDLYDARAKEFGMSTFSLGCAVIAALLNRVNDGAEDVVFGTQVAGRQEVDLEDLIGVFINNVVLRFDASGDPTMKELAKRSSDVVRDALVNQRMPFHKLVELLNPPRDLARTPLISINVIIQQAFLEDAEYGAVTLKGVPSPSPGALYDMNFQMIRRPDGWRMNFEYNTDLFTRATADMFLDIWRATFEATMKTPNMRLSELPSPLPRAPAPISPAAALIAAAEAVIAAHPDVEDAAIIEQSNGSRHVFITPRPGYAQPLETLNTDVLSFAHANLSAEGAPAGVNVLLVIPRTANGAINHNALPQPAAAPATKAQRGKTERAAREPSKAVEAKLTAIWKDVLGVPRVEPTGNFFDLGGHSLLAVRMFARVGEAFGYQPDLAALFSAPTLREFAAVLDTGDDSDVDAKQEPSAEPAPEAAAADYWQAFPIKKGQGGAALIGINHPMLFYKMAGNFDDTRGLIGAQITLPKNAEGLSGKSFETIVADCVTVMREVQPHGPYSLIGLCVNGIVAIEAARQLEAAGEEVALVTLIDSWKPGYYRSQPTWRRLAWDAETRAQRFLHYVTRLVTGKQTLVQFLSNYDFARNIMERFGLVKGLSKEEVMNWNVTDFLVDASRLHRPAPYAGKVVMFRSEASPARAGELLFGWRDVLNADTVVHDVEGWHEDAFTASGMESLAGVVTAELDAARST